MLNILDWIFKKLQIQLVVILKLKLVKLWKGILSFIGMFLDVFQIIQLKDLKKLRN